MRVSTTKGTSGLQSLLAVRSPAGPCSVSTSHRVIYQSTARKPIYRHPIHRFSRCSSHCSTAKDCCITNNSPPFSLVHQRKQNSQSHPTSCIPELNEKYLVDEDVLWLDVPMNDVVLVHERQP